LLDPTRSPVKKINGGALKSWASIEHVVFSENVRHNCRAGQYRSFMSKRGEFLRNHWPERRRKDHCVNAILGLTSYEGELKVLGCEPWSLRDKLMRDASFIADVAVLPRWIRVSQLLDYVPASIRDSIVRKAENLLAKTGAIKRTSKSQAIIERDGRPVAFSRPSLRSMRDCSYSMSNAWPGHFVSQTVYDSLLNDYFDRSRDNCRDQHIRWRGPGRSYRSHVYRQGRIVLECSMEEFDSRYLEVMVNPSKSPAASALSIRCTSDRSSAAAFCLFDRVDRDQLATLGEVRRPSIADLFVAVMSNSTGETRPPSPRLRRARGRLLNEYAIARSA